MAVHVVVLVKEAYLCVLGCIAWPFSPPRGALATHQMPIAQSALRRQAYYDACREKKFVWRVRRPQRCLLVVNFRYLRHSRKRAL